MRQATAGADAVQGIDREWELARALGALRAGLPRLAALVANVEDPDTPAVGDWSIRSTLAHLSHVSAGELFLARTVGDESSEGFPVGDDLVAGVARFNEGNIETDTERDLGVLLQRVMDNVSAFVDHMSSVRGADPVTWLSGVVLPASSLASHLVGEVTVHSYDIAGAQGRHLTIEREHAALGLGFFLDAIARSPEGWRRTFVTEEGSKHNACFDLRLRGFRRDYIVFENGAVAVEAPSARSVDCHISSDPRVAYLSVFGRISSRAAVTSGRIHAWGRRPHLALRFSEWIRNP